MHNDEGMKRKGDEPTMRKDLWALETALRKDIGGITSGLAETNKVLRNVVVEVSRLKADDVAREERYSAALQNMASQITSRMDAFMSQTLKVGSDQFWLIHRLDKIEERVARVEKRA